MKPQYAADICPSKSLSPLGPGKPLISWEKGNIPPSSPSPQGAALSPLPTSQPPVTETNQTHLVSMPKCRSQPWSAQIVLLGPAQLWHLPAPKTSAVCPQLRQNAGAQHCRANPSNGDSASHQINNSSRFPKSLTEFGYFAMKHSHCWGSSTGTRSAQGDSRPQHPLGVAGETKIPAWHPPPKPTGLQLQHPERAGGLWWDGEQRELPVPAQGTEQLQPLGARYKPPATQL